MRRFKRAWSRIPLAVQAPLLAALVTVAFSIVISQVVLSRLAEEQTVALKNLSSAFMDGLTTAVTPGLLTQDVWETFDSLDRARQQYGAVNVIFMVVTLTDGQVIAASEPNRFPVRSHLPADLESLMRQGKALTIDEHLEKAWLVRGIVQEDIRIGTVLAEIDISNLLAVRREVLMTLLAVNGGLTLFFGIAGYLLVRHMVRPLSLIQRRLANASRGQLDLVDQRTISMATPEYAQLFRQFNAMVQALTEREALSAELANQEKLAMLGRLASGMAHEVNNPLGGMMNAVDTLDVHGSDMQARRRTIDLLRRGLAGIQHVVRAALVTYKSAHRTRLLTHEDLEDLPFLIQHETGAKQLDLAWSNELPTEVQIDASSVRQIVLNMLLNACAASPERSQVSLSATISDSALTVSVGNQGPGLPDAAFAAVQAGASGEPAPAQGLGLWTASRLAARLGGKLNLRSSPGGGAVVELAAPLTKEREDLGAVA